jgi:integrase
LPRRASLRLTDKVIDALPLPAKGGVITYDKDVPGFGMRVTAKGARSFVLNYVVSGVERRMTIGQYSVWSSTAAREEARELRRKIDRGIDPMAERKDQEAAAAAERDAPSMEDLFDRYVKEHLPHKSARAAADDRSIWKQLVLPRLGAMKVTLVKSTDIDSLHADISKTRPVRANRTIEVLRKAFNLAIRWGWRSDNPVSGVRKNPEHRRARYLSFAEIIKLAEALATHHEKTSAQAIRLLMLTGARRGEVLSARWDMFDLENGIWVKPSAHTKQRKEHRVPLSAPAIELLKGLKAEALDRMKKAQATEIKPYVFPGDDGEPLTDIKRTWLAVCKKAGLAKEAAQRTRGGKLVKDKDGEPIMVWKTTVRIHDLRHTYASVLASEGLSLPIIGALLGHTQPQTTARYAHLFDDPLRAATERVGALLESRLQHDASTKENVDLDP